MPNSREGAIRTSLLVLLLLGSIAVPAASGSGKPPVLIVEANHGTLILAGNWLTPPYKFMERDGKILVNGYVRPLKTEADVQPVDDAGAAKGKCDRICTELYAVGRATHRTDDQILETWRSECSTIPHIRSATITDRGIFVVSDDGLSLFKPLPDRNAPPRPDAVTLRRAPIKDIAALLEDGFILFLDDHGGVTGISANGEPEYRAAVEKVRHGKPLSAREQILVPKEAQQLIRIPLHLVREP